MRIDEITKTRAKKNLYVSRNLLNGEDLQKWAKEQGFETCLPEDQMHVTIIHSKKEIEWDQTEPVEDELTVEDDEKHPRSIEKFGEKKDIVVLKFHSKELSDRHYEFVDDFGCSCDFPDYKAHITITYQGSDVDIAGIEAYEGDLIFGPELFDEINDNFKESFEEIKLD
jgi:hypothetical protein